MEFEDVLNNRCSVREFLPKKVEWDKITKVLDAGVKAPNSGNIQSWKFVIVTNQDTIKKIAEATRQYWVATSNALIVVAEDTIKTKRFYGERGIEFYGIQNCAAAVQNMLLEATNLGLGSCWVSAFDEVQMKTILSVPDDIRVHAIVVIGYYDGEIPRTERDELYTYTFLDQYGKRVMDPKREWSGYHSQTTRKVTEQLSKDIKEDSKNISKKIKEKFAKIKEKLNKPNSHE
jgi:nitroreductase